MAAHETRIATERARLPLEPGETLVPHVDTAMLGCGCVTHVFIGIDCAAHGRRVVGRTRIYRCLTCGHVARRDKRQGEP